MAATGPRTVAAICVAAGAGQRLAAAVPKAFVQVAGRTLLEHTVDRFAVHPGVRDIVIVAPSDLVGVASSLTPAAVVVAGGATRQASVRRGLDALADDVDLVLVHDVARPFVPAAVIDRVISALDTADAVVPAVPLTDTVRCIGDDGELAGLVDRTRLLAMQTPQGFHRDLLVRAHAGEVADATDDAALVEALGGRVVAVAGDALAFKITGPLDLALAQLVATEQAHS